MPRERLVNTAFTAPKPLLKQAAARAKRKHGHRGFSKYVRELIATDLKNASK